MQVWTKVHDGPRKKMKGGKVGGREERNEGGPFPGRKRTEPKTDFIFVHCPYSKIGGS